MWFARFAWFAKKSYPTSCVNTIVIATYMWIEVDWDQATEYWVSKTNRWYLISIYLNLLAQIYLLKCMERIVGSGTQKWVMNVHISITLNSVFFQTFSSLFKAGCLETWLKDSLELQKTRQKLKKSGHLSLTTFSRTTQRLLCLPAVQSGICTL